MSITARATWLALALLLQGCMDFGEDQAAQKPTEAGFNVGQHVSNEMAAPVPTETPAPGSL